MGGGKQLIIGQIDPASVCIVFKNNANVGQALAWAALPALKFIVIVHSVCLTGMEYQILGTSGNACIQYPLN